MLYDDHADPPNPSVTRHHQDILARSVIDEAELAYMDRVGDTLSHNSGVAMCLLILGRFQLGTSLPEQSDRVRVCSRESSPVVAATQDLGFRSIVVLNAVFIT